MEKFYKGEIQRLFPILEAIKEGKTIQWNDMGLWRDIDGDEEGFFLDTLIGKPDGYRIKPEPKYRPFKDAEECFQEMMRHQPFGWVRNKFNNNGVIATIIFLDSRKGFKIYTDFNHGNTSEDMINSFIFADGTPFGVKVEE